MAATYSTRSVNVRSRQDAVFDVERSGTPDALSRPGTVSYRTEDVTARAGTDYTATAGTLDFAAGETSRSVTVAILDQAFDTEGLKSFIFGLGGYGAATGTINPGNSDSSTQFYWLVPGTDDKVTVPTSSSAGAWAQAQMDVSRFSDPPPGDAHEAPPQSYFRLGHARADMNYTERVIAESADFFATALDGGEVVEGEDGTPVEPGSTLEYAKPRNISREADGWRAEKEGNRHLDGIFLYTTGNMTTSVRGAASNVVHKDYVQHIGGNTRYNYMGNVTTIYLSPRGGYLRNAAGSQDVDGQPLSFSVTRTRTLNVLMDDSVKYVTARDFSVNTSAQTNVFTGLKQEVSNSARLEIAGLQVQAKFDVKGNYSLDYMASNHASARTNYYEAASRQIVFQIDPAAGGTGNKALAGMAGTFAALAAAAGVTAAVPFALSDKSFAGIADPNGIKKALSQLTEHGYPASFYGLSAVSIGILVAVVYKQKIKAITPSLTPKIKMTDTALELSVGSSKIVLEDDAITIRGQEIDFRPTEATTFHTGDTVVMGKKLDVGTRAIMHGPVTMKSSLSVQSNVAVQGRVSAARFRGGN